MNCAARYLRRKAMQSGLAWILKRPKLSNRAGPDFEIITPAAEGDQGNFFSLTRSAAQVRRGAILARPLQVACRTGVIFFYHESPPVGAVPSPPLQGIS